MQQGMSDSSQKTCLFVSHVHNDMMRHSVFFIYLEACVIMALSDKMLKKNVKCLSDKELGSFT
jgi:hypothetical protein